MEFVVSNYIKIYLMVFVCFDMFKDEDVKQIIVVMIVGYEDCIEYFVDCFVWGLGWIVVVQYLYFVVVCMSDFKINEYVYLIGGVEFELKEENFMFGFCGVLWYYLFCYWEGFVFECCVIFCFCNEMGFKNVVVMIFFCWLIKEVDCVLEVMV